MTFQISVRLCKMRHRRNEFVFGDSMFVMIRLADVKSFLTVMMRTLWNLSRMKILNNKLSALDIIKESGVIAYERLQ